MDYPYACWRKNSTDVLIMSLLNKMIYYNTAVFCLRYESHANIDSIHESPISDALSLRCAGYGDS